MVFIFEKDGALRLHFFAGCKTRRHNFVAKQQKNAANGKENDCHKTAVFSGFTRYRLSSKMPFSALTLSSPP